MILFQREELSEIFSKHKKKVKNYLKYFQNIRRKHF